MLDIAEIEAIIKDIKENGLFDYTAKDKKVLLLDMLKELLDLRNNYWLALDNNYPHDDPKDCPLWYDWCNCTVHVLKYNIDKHMEYRKKCAQLEKENDNLKTILYGNKRSQQDVTVFTGAALHPSEQQFTCGSFN